MADRAQQLTDHIAKIKATPPDYPSLEIRWREIIIDRMTRFVSTHYAGLDFTQKQKDSMVILDADAYRKSLKDVDFKAQLDDIHNQAVDVLIKQLEFEKDNPGQEYEEPERQGSEEQSPFVDVFVSWVGSRISSNIEGAERESGEGAKVLRATLGISWKDIQEHGIFGGPNSFFRKPFG